MWYLQTQRTLGRELTLPNAVDCSGKGRRGGFEAPQGHIARAVHNIANSLLLFRRIDVHCQTAIQWPGGAK